jgi:hypothetical protein
MGAADYHFVTIWRIEGELEQVAAIIADAASLARWWPAVYLDVQELEPGEPSGVGKLVALYTKGWLPYTLRWRFRVSEVEPGRRIALESQGDFVGRGVWSFRQEGPVTVVRYDWDIAAAKPLLRHLSPLLKPIFAANHRWAMGTGEVSLRLELARRRARTPAELARVPPPPGPTSSSPLPLALGLALALGLLVAALRRMRR